MDANLRIIKSLQKLNDTIKQNEDKQKEDIKEIEKNIDNVKTSVESKIDDTNKKAEEYSNTQEIYKKEQDEIKEKQEEINSQIIDIKKTIKLDNQKNTDKILEVIKKVDNIKIKMPKDGKDGVDGKDGYTPIKGIDYFDGKDGVGKNGKDGKDGIGILNAKVDKNGNLIITLTNDEKINAGRVKGEDGVGFWGPPGIGVKNVEVRNNYLYVLLTDGTEINAGEITGGSGGTEVDPVFTSSPSYNITTENITNWNNKSDFSGSYDDLTDKPTLFSGNYNDLTNKPTIPSNLSDLSDDTLHRLVTDIEKQDWDNKSNFSGSYNDLTDKPTIPTIPENVSAFNNDVGYLTQHQDISNLQRKPVIIWEETNPANYLVGLQVDLSASPAWQLTNLDFTPYKRIKIYSCAGQKSSGIGVDASTTASMILEMSLDSRASIQAYGGNYVGSVISQKPNDINRLATLVCAVSSDKTSFAVLRQTNLYGTGATSNNDVNANVFMIEGYYD